MHFFYNPKILQCEKNNKDEPDEIATSPNQKTVGLLAMTDLVEKIFAAKRTRGESGYWRRTPKGGEGEERKG